jgi:hypothetical protein
VGVHNCYSDSCKGTHTCTTTDYCGGGHTCSGTNKCTPDNCSKGDSDCTGGADCTSTQICNETGGGSNQQYFFSPTGEEATGLSTPGCLYFG